MLRSSTGSDGGGANIEARQLGQIVCVMPEAEGGAVTTHWHHAQTTVRTLSVIQPLFSCSRAHPQGRRRLPGRRRERNGGACAVGGHRPPLANSLDTPCSILRRRVAKEATPA